MTRWQIRQAEILDVQAEALVCSANPSLNLSGGVGGALLLRYGNEMQFYLHRWLRDQSQPYCAPGTAVITPACGSPYLAVAHAIAIDGFYDSRPSWIAAAYQQSLDGLAQKSCRTVVAACLACGYGRLTADPFIDSIRPLIGQSFAPIETVQLVTTNGELAEKVQASGVLNVSEQGFDPQ